MMKIKNIFRNKVINKKRMVAVLFLLVLVAVMVFLNPDMRNYLFGGGEVKISFQSGIEYEVMTYGDDMLLVNNEGIRAVDDRGENAWTVVFSMTSPMTVVKNEYIMVADVNGTMVNVYEGEKLLFKVKMPNEILTARINEDGYVAVATDELGYKGVVTVFDNNGKETFKWHSGSGYIGDVALSGDGILAVSQLMTDRSSVYTRVMRIDTEKENDVKCVGEVDGIVLKVRFNGNDELLAVSQKGMFCYDEKGAKRFAVDFKGRIPVDCNIENDDNMVFAFDGGLNNTVLESYSENGKLRGKYEADSKIRTFDVNGEYILFSTMGTARRISPEGKLEGEMTTTVDAKDMKIFSDRDEFLLMGGSSAEILKIK